MFVSVTRLHLRHWWFLPAFAWHAIRSRDQLRHSEGFLVGAVAGEFLLGYWTITVWADEGAMRAFRNANAHQRAMPKLSRWCDEASYAHWEQETASLPPVATVFDRLRNGGNQSKVRHPSKAHANGSLTGKSPPRYSGTPIEPSNVPRLPQGPA